MQGIEDIPEWLADAWGITDETAQVILSIIVIFALLLPTMYLSRGQNAIPIYLIMILLASSLLVGLGWMPFWIIITEICIMAVAVAYIGSKEVTGDG